MNLVRDYYQDHTEFEDLLDIAAISATSEWEIEFTQDMTEKFQKYGRAMRLSDKQLETLKRIAHEERKPQWRN